MERKLAQFHEREDCILYASCFDANAGLFEVFQPSDAFCYYKNICALSHSVVYIIILSAQRECLGPTDFESGILDFFFKLMVAQWANRFNNQKKEKLYSLLTFLKLVKFLFSMYV